MELSKITPDDMAITKVEFKNSRMKISAVSNLGAGEKEFSVVENFMKRIITTLWSRSLRYTSR